MQEKSIHSSADRNYRSKLSLDEKEQQISLRIEESDLLITLTSAIQKQEALAFIQSKLYELRADIKAYSLIKPLFISSLSPLEDDVKSSDFIKEMLIAGKIAQIGPFSAVAGTIAEYLAKNIEDFLSQKNLPSDVIVENGGDIFLISKKERIVAILDKPIQMLSNTEKGIQEKPIEELKLGIKLSATYKENDKAKGLALCSSSATIGHSLSFGNADLLLIIAKKGSIADSFATASCNMLKSEDDFEKVLDFVKENEKNGVIAVFASCNKKIMAYGDIELCSLI